MASAGIRQPSVEVCVTESRLLGTSHKSPGDSPQSDQSEVRGYSAVHRTAIRDHHCAGPSRAGQQVSSTSEYDSGLFQRHAAS